MTQYITLGVNLSNSQLNKLKSRMKNGTGVTLNFSSNVIGYSNDRQVWRFHKTFPNNSAANIKSSIVDSVK